MTSLLDQKSGTDREAEHRSLKIQQAIENQLATYSDRLKAETDRIAFAIAASERVAKRFAAHRLMLGHALCYLGGVFTVLALRHLVLCLGSMGLQF